MWQLNSLHLSRGFSASRKFFGSFTATFTKMRLGGYQPWLGVYALTFALYTHCTQLAACTDVCFLTY